MYVFIIQKPRWFADPNPQTDSFQDEPVVIFEVLSRQTRRIDEDEKKDAYVTIPSLAAYVLLEQDSPFAVVYRRTPGGFIREVYDGIDAILPLGEIGIDVPLAKLYETVIFSEEPEEDDTV